MAIFLTAQQLYRMYQRELPEGVYADGAPSEFNTTASVYSKASLLKVSYDNMETIYNNMFPATTTEKVLDWEFAAFGELLDASLSITEKRNRIIGKLRKRPGITKTDMLNVVYSVIGVDKLVDIIEWGCATGGWVLNESQLGIETYLNGANMMDVTSFLFPTGDFCDEDHSQFGKTDEEWELMQEEAYTYEVLIYDYTITTLERSKMTNALLIEGPARAAFVISDNLDSADMLDGEA